MKTKLTEYLSEQTGYRISQDGNGTLINLTISGNKGKIKLSKIKNPLLYETFLIAYNGYDEYGNFHRMTDFNFKTKGISNQQKHLKLTLKEKECFENFADKEILDVSNYIPITYMDALASYIITSYIGLKSNKVSYIKASIRYNKSNIETIIDFNEKWYSQYMIKFPIQVTSNSKTSKLGENLNLSLVNTNDTKILNFIKSPFGDVIFNSKDVISKLRRPVIISNIKNSVYFQSYNTQDKSTINRQKSFNFFISLNEWTTDDSMVLSNKNIKKFDSLQESRLTIYDVDKMFLEEGQSLKKGELLYETLDGEKHYSQYKEMFITEIFDEGTTYKIKYNYKHKCSIGDKFGTINGMKFTVSDIIDMPDNIDGIMDGNRTNRGIFSESEVINNLKHYFPNRNSITNWKIKYEEIEINGKKIKGWFTKIDLLVSNKTGRSMTKFKSAKSKQYIDIFKGDSYKLQINEILKERKDKFVESYLNLLGIRHDGSKYEIKFWTDEETKDGIILNDHIKDGGDIIDKFSYEDNEKENLKTYYKFEKDTNILIDDTIKKHMYFDYNQEENDYELRKNTFLEILEDRVKSPEEVDKIDTAYIKYITMMLTGKDGIIYNYMYPQIKNCLITTLTLDNSVPLNEIGLNNEAYDRICKNQEKWLYVSRSPMHDNNSMVLCKVKLLNGYNDNRKKSLVRLNTQTIEMLDGDCDGDQVTILLPKTQINKMEEKYKLINQMKFHKIDSQVNTEKERLERLNNINLSKNEINFKKIKDKCKNEMEESVIGSYYLIKDKTGKIGSICNKLRDIEWAEEGKCKKSNLIYKIYTNKSMSFKKEANPMKSENYMDIMKLETINKTLDYEWKFGEPITGIKIKEPNGISGLENIWKNRNKIEYIIARKETNLKTIVHALNSI